MPYSVTRQYTYGLQRISEYQVVQGAWAAIFYQYDGRGTVRMLTNAAGAVTDTYEYDAFGNEINHTGTTPNNYLYRGEQWDPGLGLYYLRARWYNPATGRFMTRDPYEGSIYDPASLHRYNYARANPVNFIDPSGRATASDYVLLAANAVARGAVVYAFGRAVDCAFFAEASAMDLVGKTIDHQLDQFKLLFQGCEAQITVSQFVTGTLANTALGLGLDAAGWAFRSIGGLMEGAAQGEMAAPVPTLFRGTSAGAGESLNYLRFGVTPATTNPAVGTVFAIARGNQFGEGVLQLFSPETLNGIQTGDANVLQGLEAEFGISASAIELAESADATISAAEAREILESMGISIPQGIYNDRDISSALAYLAEQGTMTPEQIQQFISKVMQSAVQQ